MKIRMRSWSESWRKRWGTIFLTILHDLIGNIIREIKRSVHGSPSNHHPFFTGGTSPSTTGWEGSRCLLRRIIRSHSKILCKGSSKDWGAECETISWITWLSKSEVYWKINKLNFQAAEKLIKQLNETWEEKMRRTEEFRKTLEDKLRDMGLATSDQGNALGVSPKVLCPLNDVIQ